MKMLECFQGLAQRHDFVVHGAMCRRLAAFLHRLFVTMNAVFLDLAGSDFREAQMAEERHQVHLRPPVLAFDVDLAALALRDDVVFAQVLFGSLAESFFCFDFSAAEFSAELQVPILGDLFGFPEAVFFRACAPVFSAEITGTLPATAVRALVDVNFAAHEGELFSHRGCLPNSFKNVKSVKELCNSSGGNRLCQ